MTTLDLRSSLCALLLTVGPTLACQVPMIVGDGHGEGSGGGDGGGPTEGSATEGSATEGSATEGSATEGSATTSAPTTGELPDAEGTTSSGGDTTDAIEGSGTGTTGAVGGSEGGTTEGEPVEVVCGDGIVAGDEQCDDGNGDGYDGCEPTCERTIAEVSMEWYTTCIRTIHGDVKCWGRGEYLGAQVLDDIGDDETPASLGFVDLGAPAIDISVGTSTTCAVLETGQIRCFGSLLYSGLGLGGFGANIGDDEPPSAFPPIDFGDLGGASFVQVSSGASPCGLLDDGGVRCWGDPRSLGWSVGGFDGGLGATYHPGWVGDDETVAMAGYGDVPVGLPVTELFPRFIGQIVRTSTGSLRAWGIASAVLAMGAGATPVGVNPGDPSAEDIGDLPFDGIEMTNVSFGQEVACSVQADGSVHCWGAPNLGGIGLPGIASVGTNGAPSILEAGRVEVGGPVARVSAHDGSVCAALVDGTVRCWGANYAGQLGRGHTSVIGDDEPPSAGSAIDLGSPVAAFAEGVGPAGFCALLETGELKCWGNNFVGQLGYGHVDDVGDDPGEVGPAMPAVQVF